MISRRLKINLFGDSWKLKKVLIAENQLLKWETTAYKMKSPLYKAIIDPYFYHILKDSNIQSVEDLKTITNYGLLNSSKNQIEIWYQNKKVQKLKINDLLDELLLFPLYNTYHSKINLNKDKGIYIEQKEIGLMGSYEMKVENFRIDDLFFHLVENNNQKYLQEVTHLNQKFVLKKTDTLLVYQNSFEL